MIVSKLAERAILGIVKLYRVIIVKNRFIPLESPVSPKNVLISNSNAGSVDKF